MGERLLCAAAALSLGLFGRLCDAQPSASETAALLRFRSELQTPELIAWDTTSPLCGQQGVACNQNNNVVGLHFPFLSLQGTISSALGELPDLNWLDLYSNSLSGTIPTQIGALSKLTRLGLQNNILWGAIPSELGNLIQMELIDLSVNYLEGTIPTEFGRFSRIIGLNLQDNQLVGTVPTELLGYSPPVKELLFLRGTNNLCPLLDYSTVAYATDYDAGYTCSACTLPSTCANGGTCVGGANEMFSCQCPSGFTGSRCEIPVGPSCPAQSPHFAASWPQTPAGQVAAGTCVAGYSGSPTRQCKADGTWDHAVQNICAHTTCASVTEAGFTWPARRVGQIVNFLCPTGHSGRPTRTCLQNGQWSAINDPCVERSCPAVASYQNAAWPPTSRGQPATGACAQGYSGTIVRNCMVDGRWSPTVQGSCVRDSCAAEVSGNATWRATTAELTATGRCDEGFSGSPTRVCQADATWAATQNPCARNQCPASSSDDGTFAQSDSLTTATGTCTLPFKGAPTRVCRADGTWGAIVSPCALDCPPSVYGHATWPTSLGSRFASGTCDVGFESPNGVARRFCNQDGTWSTSMVYACLNKQCPSVQEGGVTWPATSTFSTAAVTCPSGRPLKTRRRCRSDATWDSIQNPC